MAELTGSEILAKALKNEGTDILFFLMGGPMLLAETACMKEGIRMIDVRHEQAAAIMAHAYSRLLQKPSVCMAASGPGTINLTTGVANALIDCARWWRSAAPARRASSAAGLPGDRPGRHHEAVHQMGRSRLQPQAHPGAGQHRVPEGDERQARPGLSGFSRRHPLRQDSPKRRSTGAFPAGRR